MQNNQSLYFSIISISIVHTRNYVSLCWFNGGYTRPHWIDAKEQTLLETARYSFARTSSAITTSNMLLDFHRVGHFDSLEGNMSHRKATFISKYIYIVYYPSFVVGSPWTACWKAESVRADILKCILLYIDLWWSMFIQPCSSIFLAHAL